MVTRLQPGWKQPFWNLPAGSNSLPFPRWERPVTLTPSEYCPRACNACHWISKANPDTNATEQPCVQIRRWIHSFPSWGQYVAGCVPNAGLSTPNSFPFAHAASLPLGSSKAFQVACTESWRLLCGAQILHLPLYPHPLPCALQPTYQGVKSISAPLTPGCPFQPWAKWP